MHNLVYSVETPGRSLFSSKHGSIRGKTKHAGLSSHSGSRPLATKGKQAQRKDSGKTLHFKILHNIIWVIHSLKTVLLYIRAFKWALFCWPSEGHKMKASLIVLATCVLSTHHLAEESVLNWLHVFSYQAHLRTAGRAAGFWIWHGQDKQGKGWHVWQWDKQNVI